MGPASNGGVGNGAGTQSGTAQPQQQQQPSELWCEVQQPLSATEVCGNAPQVGADMGGCRGECGTWGRRW